MRKTFVVLIIGVLIGFGLTQPIGLFAQGGGTIEDPTVNKFCNELIRPLSEHFRSGHYRLADMTTQWYAGMNVTIPNDSTVIIDGRANQGVSVLTGASVHSVMSILIAMDGEYNTEIISKPCVRQLQ